MCYFFELQFIYIAYNKLNVSFDGILMGKFLAYEGLIIDMTFAPWRVNDYNRRFCSRTTTQGKKEELFVAIRRHGVPIRSRPNRFSFVSFMIRDPEKPGDWRGEGRAEGRYIEYIEMISRQSRIHHGVSKAD